MSSIYSHPPTDPEVASIVEQLTASFEDFPALMKQLSESLEQGTTLGELRGITKDEYAALYRIACKLCDDGEFNHALPVSLHLMLHDPADSRYAFQAGSCLQRLGEFKHAAILYARTLDLNPDEAAAAYRAAECLLAIEKKVEAKALFEMAIELSRGKFHCRELQEMAEAKIKMLSQ